MHFSGFSIVIGSDLVIKKVLFQIQLDQEAIKLAQEFGVNLEQVEENSYKDRLNTKGLMGGIKDYFDSIKSGADEVRAAVTSAFQRYGRCNC